MLLGELLLFDRGKVVILGKWIVVLVTDDTALLRAHIPIPVKPYLLLFPLACVNAEGTVPFV